MGGGTPKMLSFCASTITWVTAQRNSAANHEKSTTDVWDQWGSKRLQSISYIFIQVVQYAAVCLIKSKPAGSSGNTDLPEQQSAWRLKYAILSSQILEFEHCCIWMAPENTRRCADSGDFLWFSYMGMCCESVLTNCGRELNDSMTQWPSSGRGSQCLAARWFDPSSIARDFSSMPPEFRVSSPQTWWDFRGESSCSSFSRVDRWRSDFNILGAHQVKGLWHVRRFCESRESMWKLRYNT